MSLLQFPPNPTPGQTHVIGTKTYVWNGVAWVVGANAGNFTTVIADKLTLTTTSNAISLSTGGGLTVLGGAAISQDLYVGGSIVGLSTGTGGGIGSITGGTATFARVYVTGGVQATSTLTGDLTVAGGVGIGGDLWLGGTLFSSGDAILTTASFASNVADGVDIDIVDIGGGILEFNSISTLQTVTGRGWTSTNLMHITNSSISTSTQTGALVVNGGVGVGGRVTSESLKIADAVYDSTVKSVNNVLPTVIDEFSFNEYRSAKYLIQIDEGSTSTARCQVTELLTLASNTGTVIVTEYASVYSHVDLGNFDALVTDLGYDIVVRLYFVAADTVPKIVRVLRTAITK